MLDPRITLKNRWLAGILAFLLPGAGHLYQGRKFKGIVCCASVLVTFFTGMCMGDWSVVYWKRDPQNFLNPYYAQVFVGLPALPSLIQSRRFQDQRGDEIGISGPLDTSFEGNVRFHESGAKIPDGHLVGRISIRPGGDRGDGRAAVGEFKGTLTRENGKPEERTLYLDDVPRLGPAVDADPDRSLNMEVVDKDANPPRKVGEIHGDIPRTFMNRFEAPPNDAYYLELHRNLGKYYELAMTFTMIAGLLNILVILDAVEGPAYGYGDEESPVEATSAGAASDGQSAQAIAKAAEPANR
jgi:hypothetical protein